MSDRFDEAFVESFDDDASAEWESYDDDSAEFLGTLLNPIGAITQGIGSLFGNGQRPAPRRPNVQQYPTRPPAPGAAGIFAPAITGPQQFATAAQLSALTARVASQQQAIDTINKRAEVVNNRVNTTEKKLAAEVNRINTIETVQARNLQNQQRQIRKLRSDMQRSQQTAMIMSLMMQQGVQDTIEDHTHAAVGGAAVTGGDDNMGMMLLPMMMMQDGGGGSDNNMMMMLMMMMAMRRD